MTTATHNEHYTAMGATEPGLFLAFELSEKTWTHSSGLCGDAPMLSQ